MTTPIRSGFRVLFPAAVNDAPVADAAIAAGWQYLGYAWIFVGLLALSVWLAAWQPQPIEYTVSVLIVPVPLAALAIVVCISVSIAGMVKGYGKRRKADSPSVSTPVPAAKTGPQRR